MGHRVCDVDGPACYEVQAPRPATDSRTRGRGGATTSGSPAKRSPVRPSADFHQASPLFASKPAPRPSRGNVSRPGADTECKSRARGDPRTRLSSAVSTVAGAGFEPATSGRDQRRVPGYCNSRVPLENLGFLRRFPIGRLQLYRNVLGQLPVVCDDISMTRRIQWPPNAAPLRDGSTAHSSPATGRTVPQEVQATQSVSAGQRTDRARTVTVPNVRCLDHQRRIHERLSCQAPSVEPHPDENRASPPTTLSSRGWVQQGIRDLARHSGAYAAVFTNKPGARLAQHVAVGYVSQLSESGRVALADLYRLTQVALTVEPGHDTNAFVDRVTGRHDPRQDHTS
jgi:hypothetical protein